LIWGARLRFGGNCPRPNVELLLRVTQLLTVAHDVMCFVCMCSGDISGSTLNLLQVPADSGSCDVFDVLSDVDADNDDDDEDDDDDEF